MCVCVCVCARACACVCVCVCILQGCKFPPHRLPSLSPPRSVGFTGDASEAVHYALHFLTPLLTFDLRRRERHEAISQDQVVRPDLQLPGVFQLLHHANQVTPMLVLEAVVGE